MKAINSSDSTSPPRDMDWSIAVKTMGTATELFTRSWPSAISTSLAIPVAIVTSDFVVEVMEWMVRAPSDATDSTLVIGMIRPVMAVRVGTAGHLGRRARAGLKSVTLLMILALLGLLS